MYENISYSQFLDGTRSDEVLTLVNNQSMDVNVNTKRIMRYDSKVNNSTMNFRTLIDFGWKER